MVQPQQQQQFQPPGIRPHYRPQVQPQYARQNNQVRDSNNYPTANNNYRVRNQHPNQTHRFNQQQNGDYLFSLLTAQTFFLISKIGINRGRLPSGKDQSAPAPHKNESIRNNFANIMMQNSQRRQVVDDPLPGITCV